MRKRAQILILGAGLSGLSAAYHLKKGYQIFERRSHAGGLCDTVEEGGFRFDRTGHFLHLANPRIRRLIGKLLKDPPLKLERRSRIFSHGIYTHYPFQANTYGLPLDVVAECLIGFITAAANRNQLPKQIRTFEDFILAHFGQGIAHHFMIPYNTKLWGVHPREITAAWCTRFVPLPKIEEVVSGAIGKAQDTMGYNASFFYPKSGIQELPDALVRNVQPITYQTSPSAIDYRNKRISMAGEWLPYRALINTIPLDQLIRLLVKPPKKIISAGSRLLCASLRYLDVALNRTVCNDFHWTYVPEPRYVFYRVGCYSNISEQMAPVRKSNLYVELSSRRAASMDVLMPRITAGLIEMGIIRSKDDIMFVKQRTLSHAYVIYDENYHQTVPGLLSWLEEQKIFSAGRYARWEYASMEDTIIQGSKAAEKAKEQD